MIAYCWQVRYEKKIFKYVNLRLNARRQSTKKTHCCNIYSQNRPIIILQKKIQNIKVKINVSERVQSAHYPPLQDNNR